MKSYNVKKRKTLYTAIALMIVLGGFTASYGDTDSYFPEFKQDEMMEAGIKQRNMLNSGVQYGLWVIASMIDERDGSKRLTTSVTTLRPWLKTWLWNDSSLYVRGKYSLTAALYQKGYGIDDLSHVLDLDVGYISMATPNYRFQAQVGRKYFVLGSGVVLNGRGDGADIGVYTPYLNIRIIGLYTGFLSKDDNPYRLSDKDIAKGARRLFGGGEISTEMFNQTLYFMGLAQYDIGLEYWWESTKYFSHYYGVGLRGVIHDRISYNGEFIYELGKSFVSGYPKLNDINAMAAVLNVNYFVGVMLNPVIMAQYAFGSGDKDKDNYAIPNGNTNKIDHGFLGFGTYVGGYALRPNLANIHVIRFGASFTPFSWTDMVYFKQMTLVAKYSYYLKHQASAPINDGSEAQQNKREIGHGFDLSLRWLLLSDAALYCNYGYFKPGDAYKNQNPLTKTSTYKKDADRHFVMVGVNISI